MKKFKQYLKEAGSNDDGSSFEQEADENLKAAADSTNKGGSPKPKEESGSSGGGEKPNTPTEKTKEQIQDNPEEAKDEVKNNLKQKVLAKGKIPVPRVEKGELPEDEPLTITPFGSEKEQVDYAKAMQEFFNNKEDRVERFKFYGLRSGWEDQMNENSAKALENLLTAEPDFLMTKEAWGKINDTFGEQYTKMRLNSLDEIKQKQIVFMENFVKETSDEPNIEAFFREYQNSANINEFYKRLIEKLAKTQPSKITHLANKLKSEEEENAMIQLLSYAGYAYDLNEKIAQLLFTEAGKIYVEIFKPEDSEKKDDGKQ